MNRQASYQLLFDVASRLRGRLKSSLWCGLHDANLPRQDYCKPHAELPDLMLVGVLGSLPNAGETAGMMIILALFLTSIVMPRLTG